MDSQRDTRRREREERLLARDRESRDEEKRLAEQQRAERHRQRKTASLGASTPAGSPVVRPDSARSVRSAAYVARPASVALSRLSRSGGSSPALRTGRSSRPPTSGQYRESRERDPRDRPPTERVARETRGERELREAAEGNVQPRFGRGQWTMDEIELLIRDMISSRTAKASVEKQTAFKLFGRPREGITERAFRKQLAVWGIELSRSEARTVFARYDYQGNGTLDFYEFLDRVLAKDYPALPWNVHRDEEIMEAEKGKMALLQDQRVNNPVSLKKWRWNLDQIERLLQEKILARTAKATVEKQDAFKLFGRPQEGITPPMFKRVLRGLGLDLTDQEVRALFKRYDDNDSGVISFKEFIDCVMPKDYSAETWNVARDEEVAEARSKQTAENTAAASSSFRRASRNADHFPASLANNRWSTEEIERMIQEKIMCRTRRPNVQFQDAFKVFGRPQNGINRHTLQTKIAGLGILLSDAEIETLFRKYDSAGSGLIEFHDFIQGVMPTDYPEQLWNVRRDAEVDAQEKAKAEEHRVMCNQAYNPPALRNYRWTTDEVERLVQDKIRAHTSKATVEIQDAFKLFGRPAGGLTLAAFRNKLHDLGVDLLPEEAHDLFSRYDKDSSGRISFHDFADGLLMKDYTGPVWNIERDLEHARALSAASPKKKRAEKHRRKQQREREMLQKSLYKTSGVDLTLTAEAVPPSRQGSSRR